MKTFLTLLLAANASAANLITSKDISVNDAGTPAGFVIKGSATVQGANGLKVDHVIDAESFTGAATGLNNIPAGNLVGTVPAASVGLSTVTNAISAETTRAMTAESLKLNKYGNDTVNGELSVDGNINVENIRMQYGGHLNFQGPVYIGTSCVTPNIYVTEGPSPFPAWEDKGAVTGSSWMSAVTYGGGKIYIIGSFEGNTNNTLYDPVTESWSTKTAYPSPLQGASAAYYDGNVYIMGGVGTATVRAYNPISNAWTDKATLSHDRTGAMACVVSGKIYLIGGDGCDGAGCPDNSNEVYDSILNTWTTKTAIPTSRIGAPCGVVNGEIYVFGGTDGGSTVYDTVEKYNPINDTWVTKTPMPNPSSTALVQGIGEKLYVLDGSYHGTQIYTPILNSWVEGTTSTVQLSGNNGSAAVGNAIYIPNGGGDNKLYKFNSDYSASGVGGTVKLAGDVEIGSVNPSTISKDGYFTFANIAAPAAAKGRLYFDTAGALKVSLDGGTFVSLATGSVSGGTEVVSDAAQFSGLGTGASPLTLMPSSVTLAGNSFNGANKLVRLDGSGNLPSAGAGSLTNIPAGNLAGTVPAASVGLSTVTDALNLKYDKTGGTLSGDVQVGDVNASTISTGGYYTFANIAAPAAAKGRLYFDTAGALRVSLDGGTFVSLATGSVSGGTEVVSDAAQFSGLGTGASPLTLLSSSVTMAGNSFNGASQLVQNDANGRLAALNVAGQETVIGSMTVISNLGVSGTSAFGAIATKSTFSTTGALTMALGAGISAVNSLLSISTVNLSANGMLKFGAERFAYGWLNRSDFFGRSAGNPTGNLSGDYNTGIGDAALTNLTSGELNTAIGSLALYSLRNGTNNTAVGVQTLYSEYSGNSNTAIGNYALKSSSGALGNTAVGYSALLSVTTGTTNTAVGYSAGTSITYGSHNALFGNTPGNNITYGIGNTFIGGYATGAGVTTGSYNTALGYGATVGPTQTGAIAFGYNVTATCDYCTNIGGTYVGINNTTPQTQLDVAGISQFGTTKKSTFTAAGNLDVGAQLTVAGSTFTVGTNGIVSMPSNPLALVKVGASQIIQTASLQLVYWGTNVNVTQSMHSQTESSQTITIPVGGTGTYDIDVSMFFPSTQTVGGRSIYIYNGGTGLKTCFWENGTSASHTTCDCNLHSYSLTAGNTILVYVYLTNVAPGMDIYSTTVATSWLSVRKVQ